MEVHAPAKVDAFFYSLPGLPSLLGFSSMAFYLAFEIPGPLKARFTSEDGSNKKSSIF
jgi:hypothetical protein